MLRAPGAAGSPVAMLFSNWPMVRYLPYLESRRFIEASSVRSDVIAQPRSRSMPLSFAVVAFSVRLTTAPVVGRSEEHTSELQSLMRISYAVFCLKKKNRHTTKSQPLNTRSNKELTDDTI